MRILKENYEGLPEVDSLSKDLKDILLKPDIQELFKKNEFGTLYKKLPLDLVNDFTQLMTSLDIDPLNYLEYIPKSFLAFTSIEHLDIPKHITRISDYAFRNCYELTDIIIPNQVKRIGNWAFSRKFATALLVAEVAVSHFFQLEQAPNIEPPDKPNSIAVKVASRPFL